MSNRLLKIELYWWAITAIIAIVMYITDDETHYQVIGVIFVFIYSLIFNLIFLLGRFIYLKIKKKHS